MLVNKDQLNEYEGNNCVISLFIVINLAMMTGNTTPIVLMTGNVCLIAPTPKMGLIGGHHQVVIILPMIDAVRVKNLMTLAINERGILLLSMIGINTLPKLTVILMTRDG